MCGEFYCTICDAYLRAGHLCYMKPDPAPVDRGNQLFIFYDLEIQQETVLDEDKLHQVNLCVVQQSCDACNLQDELVGKIYGSCGIFSTRVIR